jgi:hypothetical protein
VTTPIRPYVRKVFEAVRNAMIDLFLILVGFVIRFANTLRDNFGIALRVTGVLAVCTLHSSRVFEEVSTKGTSHDVIELLLDKFVALLLVNFLLFLSNSSLSIEADVEWSSGNCLLLEAHCQVNSPCWFERKP